MKPPRCRVTGVDPGTTKSAWIIIDDQEVMTFGWVPNNELAWDLGLGGDSAVGLEWIESYGPDINAGADVFNTCRWIGRFEQAVENGLDDRPCYLITRREVRLQLTGMANAKNKHIRQALLDMWGGKADAIGSKKAPGPLYGI